MFRQPNVLHFRPNCSHFPGTLLTSVVTNVATLVAGTTRKQHLDCILNGFLFFSQSQSVVNIPCFVNIRIATVKSREDFDGAKSSPLSRYQPFPEKPLWQLLGPCDSPHLCRCRKCAPIPHSNNPFPISRKCEPAIKTTCEQSKNRERIVEEKSHAVKMQPIGIERSNKANKRRKFHGRTFEETHPSRNQQTIS